MMSDIAAATVADVAYLARIRKARDRRAVLKMRFVDLRGRCPGVPILVFEGDDDKIVYGRWIVRLRSGLPYEPFVCKGKNGVRALQAMLLNDLGRLADGVYLLVDRDYDDDWRLVVNDNLFITDRYSIENYLVTEKVLQSVLRDELPCGEHPEIREQVVSLFSQQYEKFLQITKEFNWRLFVARRKNISLNNSLPDKIANYAAVSLNNMHIPEPPAESHITLGDSLSADDEKELRSEFESFDAKHRYRGKNAMLFFEAWMLLLCNELSLKKESVFCGPNNSSRVRRDELGIGTYASKSAMPLGLPEFLGNIPFQIS